MAQMAGIYLPRLTLARCRTLVVWALMPLSAVNGQTIVGCGCTGHFEATCHCASCDSSGAAVQPERHQLCAFRQGDVAGRSSCCQSQSTNAPQTGCRSLALNEAKGFQGHHCIKVVLQSGESIKAAPPQAHHQLGFSTALPPWLDLPITYRVASNEHVFSFDSGPPPCDVIVTLHRLII